MAKPCLLVKKSVLNCRTTKLKVLCRSLGRAGPLSSFSRTPFSTGPSQMRNTSWSSSVSKTRKWSLNGEKKQAVTRGSAPSFQGLPVRQSHAPKKDLQEGRGLERIILSISIQPAPPVGGHQKMGTRVREGRFGASCLLSWSFRLPLQNPTHLLNSTRQSPGLTPEPLSLSF